MNTRASAWPSKWIAALSSRRVTRVLEWVIQQRGQARGVRCDNGPEFTSRHFLAWCEEQQIRLIHIQPGRPMQNGRVESFNGRLRDECLNANWFPTMSEAKRKIEAWREEYNRERPHSSLGYRTPEEFAAEKRARSRLTNGNGCNCHPDGPPVGDIGRVAERYSWSRVRWGPRPGGRAPDHSVPFCLMRDMRRAARRVWQKGS